MKYLKYILALLIFVLPLLESCNKNSYAEQRKKEKEKLSNYLSNSGFNILESPADSAYLVNLDGAWPKNVWYKTCRGAYVRITSIDQDEAKPKEGDQIVMRWKAYDLDGNLTGDNTNPTKSREGTVFVYTPAGYYPSEGWNDCIPFMRHGCTAQFIIESVIGPTEQQSAVVSLRIYVTDFTVRNK